jgi:large subunit ribosomal protein L22
MEARAIRKHIRHSPTRMRRVVNVVRGKRVPDALNILTFLPHKATRPIRLTILNAVHNLMDQQQESRISEEDLVIREIRVDGGSMFKRMMPATRGRAFPILKRTSHLTVIVGTPEEA